MFVTAGITVMYLSIASRYFSPKNPTNMMPGRASLDTRRRKMATNKQKKSLWQVIHYAGIIKHA